MGSLFVLGLVTKFVTYLYVECSFKATSKETSKWPNNRCKQRHGDCVKHKGIHSHRLNVRHPKLKHNEKCLLSTEYLLFQNCQNTFNIMEQKAQG